MKSVWKAIYGTTEIRVENTWFHGEKLYINNELQDETNHLFPPAKLVGEISTESGIIPVRANIYSGFFALSVDCSLFVGNKKVKVHKVQ